MAATVWVVVPLLSNYILPLLFLLCHYLASSFLLSSSSGATPLIVVKNKFHYLKLSDVAEQDLFCVCDLIAQLKLLVYVAMHVSVRSLIFLCDLIVPVH